MKDLDGGLQIKVVFVSLDSGKFISRNTGVLPNFDRKSSEIHVTENGQNLVFEVDKTWMSVVLADLDEYYVPQTDYRRLL